jgi:hypothetical protein
MKDQRRRVSSIEIDFESGSYCFHSKREDLIDVEHVSLMPLAKNLKNRS